MKVHGCECALNSDLSKDVGFHKASETEPAFPCWCNLAPSTSNTGAEHLKQETWEKHVSFDLCTPSLCFILYHSLGDIDLLPPHGLTYACSLCTATARAYWSRGQVICFCIHTNKADPRAQLLVQSKKIHNECGISIFCFLVAPGIQIERILVFCQLAALRK